MNPAEINAKIRAGESVAIPAGDLDRYLLECSRLPGHVGCRIAAAGGRAVLSPIDNISAPARTTKQNNG